MKCPKCLIDCPEGKKFCRKCGTALPLACSHCGAGILQDDQFCGECGGRLEENPQRKLSASEGERKYVAVLFSDLSGYTAMLERLDPEEVKEITSRILGEAAGVVDRYDGFIEKYVGDAVMALFGVPKVREDDHFRAIKAAQDIHGIVDGIGARV